MFRDGVVETLFRNFLAHSLSAIANRGVWQLQSRSWITAGCFSDVLSWRLGSELTTDGHPDRQNRTLLGPSSGQAAAAAAAAAAAERVVVVVVVAVAVAAAVAAGAVAAAAVVAVGEAPGTAT